VRDDGESAAAGRRGGETGHTVGKLGQRLQGG
jgi:hypothetical protein